MGRRGVPEKAGGGDRHGECVDGQGQGSAGEWPTNGSHGDGRIVLRPKLEQGLKVDRLVLQDLVD